MLSTVYIIMYNLPYYLNQNLFLSFVYVEKSMDTGAQQQYGVLLYTALVQYIILLIQYPWKIFVK